MAKPTHVLLIFLFLSSSAWAQVRIGFVDPAMPKETPKRNAAALAFAQNQSRDRKGAEARQPEVTRLHYVSSAGWQDPQNRPHAPEEFDVIWYHQGDDLAAAGLDEPSRADLLAYLEGGGGLLLSGAAGRLLNDMGIEPTPLRVLGPTEAAFVSGIRVRPNHASHPIFAGLDTKKVIVLTRLGGNALADFYGTDGPHGELLADGNATSGERPLVEYTVGAGRVIFVGWRLPDFTTGKDEYRPNLERLFANILQYLAQRNTNRARLVPPPGKYRYARLLGVPFLRADKPFVPKDLPVAGEKSVVMLTTQPDGGETFPVDGAYVHEMAISGNQVNVQALAVTLLSREQPVSRFVEMRKAEQAAADRRDQEMMQGLRVIKPSVTFQKAPLKPLQMPRVDQSVLLGHSPFMAPGDGKGDITPVYEPVEDGGFRISGSKRRLNRPIVHGQNRVWTGDVPIFRMDAPTGNGSYAKDERIFPLWPRPDAQMGNVSTSMGTLRLGVASADRNTHWMDELAKVTATFRPGYTDYQVADPDDGWKASISIAPAMDFHGMICRVEFDKDVRLVWQYGGMWWQATEANANRVEIRANEARITEPNLPNGLVLAGWDGEGQGQAVETPFGQQAEFSSSRPRRVFHIVATWGVTKYDEERARKTMARLDTPASAPWPEIRDRLKKMWFDCYIGRALEPEQHFRALMASPEQDLQRTRAWWDRRREDFQIKTPDPHLNALINWSRCTTEYHRQGPGLVLGAQIWQMYSHISTGWYGKEWGGDHQAMEECLRLYGAMQGEDGFIRWVSPSLVAFNAEDNTPYWVDQVWRHYTWTGNKQFVQDMWPMVRKAVAWMQQRNDPDGDGLFRDSYEYWNCDSNGKGPKAAAPSAMAWAMLDRAARMAAVVGDAKAESEYRAQVERTQKQILRELWNEDEGRLGSVGADGIWRGHPQTWEEYLAINAGFLSPEQGRRAMRWVASHYGFEPQPGVRLLMCSDWWPIRWSCQWVPTGDTCLAALAGMKSGDPDLWWPFLKTVVLSSFHSDFPGINMGISNAGAGGGDREDVDSVDPHTHAVVRGLFGIEPALQEGRLDICPAFPSDWPEASIRTPDVSYEYKREGDRATFRIRTPRNVVKRVKANLAGPEVVTPLETESVVTVAIGPALPPPQPPEQPPILADTLTAGTPHEAAPRHQVLFDLSDAFNVTVEEFVGTKFTFDYADRPGPLSSWWGNPTLTMPPSPRVIAAPNGVRFLTAGRPRPGLGKTPKNLLALASWRPYPLPGGASINVFADRPAEPAGLNVAPPRHLPIGKNTPVGLRCQKVWLLLQSYVHPMKNYIPNGEVVLHYAGGKQTVESLIPPFNLDCYFQHFSLKGTPVPLGRLGPWPIGWTPIHKGMAGAHADVLEVICDPGAVLDAVELRATCSEGVLGLAGMTAMPTDER